MNAAVEDGGIAVSLGGLNCISVEILDDKHWDEGWTWLGNGGLLVGLLMKSVSTDGVSWNSLFGTHVLR